VGLTGTSAGGHLALLAALKPADPQFAALPHDPMLDAKVAYVVALWPVICPRRRYAEVVLGGTTQAHPDRPAGTTRQMAYWLTEEAMEEGSPLAALQRGDAIDQPPVLIVQTATDPFHPVAHAREFVIAYRDSAGAAELHLVDGEPYYLVRSEPDSPSGRAALSRMAAFIHSTGNH
jgi:acetyl esterase